MKVTTVPSGDSCKPSSDFELKLVTSIFVGTGRVLMRVPSVVIWSRKIGEVTPKLPSTKSLFQTLLALPIAGNAPVLVAVPVGQTAVAGQLGGSFWPIVTVVASPV